MYKLQKYKGRDTRHICPECKQPHKFTWYINTETGESIASHVGKCDRENKCGYHYTPKQYYADNGIKPEHNPKPQPEPIQLPPSTHNYQLVDKSREVQLLLTNKFVLFLNNNLGAEKVDNLVNLYKIGATRDGGIVFWQLDKHFNIRAGKIMYYSIDGHRKATNWVHSKFKLENYNLVQCFFGEHLLSEFPGARVNIVESEKTALICRAIYPDFIWLGAGSLHGLKNANKMKVLYGREVTLYPDLGAYSEWSKTAKQYRFGISDYLEKNATKVEREKGLDLADFLIK